MSLTSMQPTATVQLFPDLSEELLTLLRQLAPEDWGQPTACPGWSVKDLVAHLLGGNIGRLSFGRDHLLRKASARAPSNNAELIDWINEQNATWVQAAERISPPVLIDFLAVTDRQVAEFFTTLDMDAPAPISVGWAGETQSTNWFDVGREYTEKWFHQQQIREAVGAPGLMERRWLLPVIELCLRALPYTYREVAAADSTAIRVRITGAAGGVWSLVRENQDWQLYAGEATPAAADVQLSDDTAWRLFTKGLDRAELLSRMQIDGDAALGATVADLVAIMA
ncbi:MAG: maleylpyruvate isomerase family mycothiol-dependent enzyme [Chloroflexi bacterium]|nr:maleylpyruvate isomerase family mycothiol-dependent enzyme [Chloroflexota bacterium]